MDDYKKLNNQPLNIVLAEFRFSQVMKIAEYIPELQDAFRKKYPIVADKKVEQTVQIQPSGMQVTNIDRWGFVSADKKSAIEISQERIVYYTADYPRFDGFLNECRNVIDVLHRIVEPSLMHRIGLRYGDLILIDENEDVSKLLDQCYGLPKSLEGLGEAPVQRNETILKTDIGVMVIKSLYGKHPLVCMPDLQDMRVNISTDKEPSLRMILDFDHFWEEIDGVSFDVDDISEKLRRLHDVSREAFWKITSDYARNEKWS